MPDCHIELWLSKGVGLLKPCLYLVETESFLHIYDFYAEPASNNFCKHLCLSRKHCGNFDEAKSTL